MNILCDGVERTRALTSCVRAARSTCSPKRWKTTRAAFSKKALPYGLILVPSDSFGVPGYFRIAFCTDTKKVVRSIDAFKKFVKAEYR